MFPRMNYLWGDVLSSKRLGNPGKINRYTYYWILTPKIGRLYRDVNTEQLAESLFAIITAMPIMWPCPGHPKCRKIYLYGQGFRAHIASCKHAQSKKVRGRREALETMFSIVCFTESRNLGNITLARRRIPDFRQEPATLCRVWRHCDKRCQRQIHASHLDWIYHRSKHQSEWDR